MSPKTLQRWHSEGRGPRFLKLSKRVIYPLDEIQHFENNALYESTWQKASDVILASDTKWLTPRQLAAVMGLPMYTLTHPNVRKTLGIPHSKVGKLIRFNAEEVMGWARKWSEEARKPMAQRYLNTKTAAHCCRQSRNYPDNKLGG